MSTRAPSNLYTPTPPKSTEVVPSKLTSSDSHVFVMTVITNALIVSKITKLYLKNVLKKAALPDNTKNTENASPIPLDVKPSTISEIAPSAPPASTTTTMTVSAPAPEELS